MNCHQLRGLKQHKRITLSFWTSEVQKWVLQRLTKSRCLQGWRLWEECISLPLAAFRNWWCCITPASASPSHLLHWPSPSHLSLTGILVITQGHLDNPRGSLPLRVLNWITAEVPLSCKVTYSQVPRIRMWTSLRLLFCLLIPSYAQENKGAIISPRSHSLRVEHWPWTRSVRQQSRQSSPFQDTEFCLLCLLFEPAFGCSRHSASPVSQQILTEHLFCSRYWW